MLILPLRRSIPAMLVGFMLMAGSLQAQAPIPVTVGGGLQTSFVHTGSTPSTGSNDRFLLDSARIYLNGTAAPTIKFMFNTEYEGSTNKIGILDAVGRYEPTPKFNIWMGRFIQPSDRANLYGPYYAHEWGPYHDGIQDGYPSALNGGSPTGRNNGIAYWGDYGKVKVSAGVSDGPTTTGTPKVVMAGRVQVDFWDKESGYYLNGTYYGGKNLLSLGGAFQSQSSNTSATGDFLLERKVKDGGAFTVESEYSYYDKLGGYDSRYGLSRGAYVLGSFMFPQPVGMGKIEILGKYGEASFARGATAADIYYTQKTSEANLNYVIKEFNARVMSFYKNYNFSARQPDFWQVGLGLQIQM
jgi:hypothetical protein